MPKNYKIHATAMCLYVNGLQKKKTLKKNFVTSVTRSTNVSNVPLTIGKSLFIVVHGNIRKRKSKRHIDFTQHVNIQRLLEQAD